MLLFGKIVKILKSENIICMVVSSILLRIIAFKYYVLFNILTITYCQSTRANVECLCKTKFN